jgi:hypothetical protein
LYRKIFEKVYQQTISEKLMKSFGTHQFGKKIPETYRQKV